MNSLRLWILECGRIIDKIKWNGISIMAIQALFLPVATCQSFFENQNLYFLFMFVSSCCRHRSRHLRHNKINLFFCEFFGCTLWHLWQEEEKNVFFIMVILNLLEEKVYENVSLYVNLFILSIPGECRWTADYFYFL